ncbi:MAG: hypothetical protein L0K86_02825 [Actinomycetia bacterium]|nr:hypothetical protein [Actinomycetes bacterium]
MSNNDASTAANLSTEGSGERQLVLVTGTGRSGTSTITGTFQELGLHVPGTVRQAQEANPRGFFEPHWVVDLHTRMLDRARAHTMDGDPRTAARAKRSVNASTLDELTQALSSAVAENPRLVIKDPRTVWFIPMWTRIAESLGMDVSFATMLRHPAEAIASRTVHWSSSENAERVRSRQIANLAGWVNVSLMNEDRTRGKTRAFIRYDDLLADWRSTIDLVGKRLDLSYEGAPIDQRPHPIDEFIDPDLKRVTTGWDDVASTPQLRDLAERVWDALQFLAEPRSDADKAGALLDDLRVEYDALYSDARGIVLDASRAAIETAVRKERAAKRKSEPADQ